MKLAIFRRTICIVNSHLAAHQKKIVNRNADFEYIYNHMVFGPQMGVANMIDVANTTTGCPQFFATSV